MSYASVAGAPRSQPRLASRRLGVGSIGGIPIQIDPSWILVFLLVAWSAAAYFPRALPGRVPPLSALGLGAIASLALFGSILAHELSHSLVARWLGYHVRSITLFIFGGVSEIEDEPRTGSDEFAIAAVGPVMSLVIAGTLEGADRLLALPIVMSALVHYLAAANLAIALFNLVPGFPLDGGRLLRAVFRGGGRSLVSATRAAALVGRGIGLALVALGISSFLLGGGLGGAWVALVGWFLRNAAQRSWQQVALKHRLEELKVGDVAQQLLPLAPEDTVGQALHGRGLLAGGPESYPVVHGGILVGLVSAAALRAVPHERWDETRVVELTTRAAATIGASSSLIEAVKSMGEHGASVVPVVDERGRYQGLLRMEDVGQVAADEAAVEV